MAERAVMIRGVRFDFEGPETRSARPRAGLRNSPIERKLNLPPLVELNIQYNGLNRDLRLDTRDKSVSMLIGLDSAVSAPQIITSPEAIETLVLTKIENLRARLGNRRDTEFAARIAIMKSKLGITQNEKGEWQKNQTELTHILQIPSKLSVPIDYAIVGIGVDGLTITPLTNQEGWVKMISPKVYIFTINIKPGESAEVKFGFRW